MMEFKYDTQLLIEGNGLDEDAINEYIRANFKGDSDLGRDIRYSGRGYGQAVPRAAGIKNTGAF